MAKVLWILCVWTIVYCCLCCPSVSAAKNTSTPLFTPFSKTHEPENNDTGELKTFQEVENKMRQIIDSVIRQVLPYVIRASSDINLSGKCMASIFKFVIGMQKLQEWAIRMIDATGKPPSGVIQGTSMSLGDFDECLNVQVGKGGKEPTSKEDEFFHGKYCIVECKMPSGIISAVDEYNGVDQAKRWNTSIGKTKTFLHMLGRLSPFVKEAAFRFGVCIPSLCNEEDLTSIINTATKQIGFPLKVLHCEEKQDMKLRVEHIVILSVFVIIIGIVLLGTTVDSFYYSKRLTDPTKPKSIWEKLAASFSIINNTKKLFKLSPVTDLQPIPMLKGIFFLTVMLNILAHTYLLYNHLFFYKYSSVLNYLEFMKQFSFSFIANGSNGIENYFFVAGFVMTYARWRTSIKKATVDFPKLLLRPYIRMTLIQLLVIGLFLCLPLIGFGPFWKDFVGPYLENCRTKWWINLFYIQNYWNSEDSCLYHTWLLAVVMQLYVISIVIIWLLIKRPNFGIAVVLAAIVVGMGWVGATVFVEQLPGALSLYLVDLDSGTKMWNSIYIKTFDHVGAFSIGLLTGYSLGKYQDRIKLRPMWVAVCWGISLASLLAVICGLYEYRYGGVPMNPSLAILYAMLNRNVYSLFLAWFVIAAATGNAWFIPSLLSWKAFIPAYRLSFLAYLIHLVVIYYHVGILRERVYLSHEENVLNYFGYLVSTYLISYICYIFFQAPYMHLEKMLITKLKTCWPWRRRKDQSSINSVSTVQTTEEKPSKLKPEFSKDNVSSQTNAKVKNQINV